MSFLPFLNRKQSANKRREIVSRRLFVGVFEVSSFRMSRIGICQRKTSFRVFWNIWQVQRHLQLRIEAQGKYMQSILEKACQTLAGENMASGSYKGIGPQGLPADMGAMKDFGSPLNFPSFQDLNIYGGDQLDLQQNMERPPLDGFMQNNDNICLGKKRPSPYSGSGKSPLIWSDDLRLQDLGTACTVDDQIQIAPPSMDRGAGADMDSISDIYETKPVLQSDEKKFEASVKLDRPSPRRAPLGTDRMSPMINTGAMPQGRNSPFG